MKRIILATSLIAAIVIVSSGLLLNQNGALPEEPTQTGNATQTVNQAYNAKITEFALFGWGVTGGVAPVGGSFNVTLQNMEDRDLQDLILEIKVLDGNGNKIAADTYFYGPGTIGYGAQFEPFDGILHANETRIISGGIITDLDLHYWTNLPRPLTTIVDLKLGNQIIDQWRSSEKTTA